MIIKDVTGSPVSFTETRVQDVEGWYATRQNVRKALDS